MSCQTLAIPPALPAPRIVPRRPQRVTRPDPRRSEVEGDNLFADLFGVPEPLSRGAAARARALRVIEAATHPAPPTLDVANLWADPHPAPRPRPAPSAFDPETRALRQALCAPPDRQPDEPATVAERDRLRLAVHAMNTTLTMAYPPVGAVVMTYTFLRGENLRLTARTMVMMSMVVTLMHGHIPGI